MSLFISATTNIQTRHQSVIQSLLFFTLIKTRLMRAEIKLKPNQKYYANLRDPENYGFDILTIFEYCCFHINRQFLLFYMLPFPTPSLWILGILSHMEVCLFFSEIPKTMHSALMRIIFYYEFVYMNKFTKKIGSNKLKRKSLQQFGN